MFSVTLFLNNLKSLTFFCNFGLCKDIIKVSKLINLINVLWATWVNSRLMLGCCKILKNCQIKGILPHIILTEATSKQRYHGTGMGSPNEWTEDSLSFIHCYMTFLKLLLNLSKALLLCSTCIILSVAVWKISEQLNSNTSFQLMYMYVRTLMGIITL